MIKQVMHFTIIMLAALLWLLLYWLFVISLFLVILADKIIPNSDKGNYWSYATPKWSKHGGYLAIRKLSDNKFLGLFPVVHALWIKEFSKDNVIEQTIPVNRSISKLLPLQTFYFRYRISQTEKPKNAKVQ